MDRILASPASMDVVLHVASVGGMRRARVHARMTQGMDSPHEDARNALDNVVIVSLPPPPLVDSLEEVLPLQNTPRDDASSVSVFADVEEWTSRKLHEKPATKERPSAADDSTAVARDGRR